MKTSAPWGLFVLRLFLASIIARVAASGIMGIFTELAKTEDWVLEYRYWITGGIYLVGVGILVGIMLLTRSQKAGVDHEEDDKVKP
jgi:hypothetical protein